MAGIELFMVILLLAVLGVAAMTFGVDTRDGSTDPRRPGGLS